MIDSKNKVNSIFFRNIIYLVLSIIVSFCISIKKSDALLHEWVGVPKSEYGEQLWDRQSIKRNEDGSVRVLSKFIPKTQSEITKDILYTMDINCFEKSFFLDRGGGPAARLGRQGDGASAQGDSGLDDRLP